MVQSVLRGTLVGPLQRRVMLLTFNRYSEVTCQLAATLEQAASSGAVVLAAPGALKSLMLKFLETLHVLDATARGCQEGLRKVTGRTGSLLSYPFDS